MRRPTTKARLAATLHSSFVSAALPLSQCYAKTHLNAQGQSLLGRTVEDHCRIVGAVAHCLLQRMPTAQRALFPELADVPPRMHDVGKVCPTFQKKIRRGVSNAGSVPEVHAADPQQEAQWGGHSAVSMAALTGCHAAPHVAEIVGQHHGFSVQYHIPEYHAFGGAPWQERRKELVTRLLAGDVATADLWPQIHSPEQARLVAGLTIVADWIGSGARFDDPAHAFEDLVEEAVDAAGFMPLRLRADLSFEDIFSFKPQEVQQKFYEQVSSPGVYILEAPMGMGKTEAALYAAYGMLQRGDSSGIYFALPTQLTSNRIHTRLNAFLAKILEDTEYPHARLLHAKAWLTRFLQQEMGEDAAPDGAWFNEGKRGILAPFAAGTVDQALMAAMHVRHSAVRAYGLAGKTVILDEVHSYDAYTGVIVDALVDLLRHYGCTVIILSATLTAQRRAVFTSTEASAAGNADAAAIARQQAYPLVSVSRNNESCQSIPCTQPDTSTVALTHTADDTPALEEALLRAEQGQQVLWIENTVAEAQAHYRLLAARGLHMGLEIGLVHSRFTPADRSSNEDHWTRLFGKNSPQRSAQGRILVGTQVLEQSLDIDADFLVTRFCPTDMLLQRMGRLWRHISTPRPATARCEACLLHAPLTQVRQHPTAAWGNTAFVYMPYVLYRSLEQWEQRVDVILPCDIRTLLEATYAPRQEEDERISRTLYSVQQERDTLRGLALRGISTDGTTLKEEKASTRAGQRPEVDVLLLRGIDHEHGTVTLADYTTLRLAQRGGQTWLQRREAAARLHLNMVRVAEYKAPAPLPAPALAWLRPWLHCVDPHTGEAIVRVAIIGQDDALHDLYGRRVGKGGVWYRSDYGYMAE